MSSEFEIKKELEKSEAYQNSRILSGVVRQAVVAWDYFDKKTTGSQFSRSVDSICSNIAESFGRFFYRDKLVFLYYARGSLLESIVWFELACERKLLKENEVLEIAEIFTRLPKQINVLIGNIRRQIKK